MDTQTLPRSLFATSVVVLFTLSSPALAVGISAGTLIENTATAEFDDGSGGRQTINSNTVTVRVDELLNVTVTSLDSGPVQAVPGDNVLTFEVTNTGNGPEAFELVANPAVAGNDIDTTITAIAIDTNNNGTYDAGVDTILTSPETTPELAADAAITVFVIANVPGGASDGDLSAVELTANAETGTGAPGTEFSGQGEGGGDAIVGATGASAAATGTLTIGVSSISLAKSVSLVDPFGGDSAVPGSTATFTILASVSGANPVDNVVVEDVIPTGTTYVANSLELDGSGLSDGSGDDAGEASQANGISVDLGTINGGASRTITFDVTID
ncbi:MAG: hypothetical protein AAFR01_00895 [Pseudomonadota bacterium]